MIGILVFCWIIAGLVTMILIKILDGDDITVRDLFLGAVLGSLLLVFIVIVEFFNIVLIKGKNTDGD